MNKKLLFFTLLLISYSSFGQKFNLIWEENFNGYRIPSGVEGESDGDNTTNKPINIGDYTDSFSKWTIDASNASLQNFSDYAAVFRTNAYFDPHFRVQDTHGTEITAPEGGHINWITESIDVSKHKNVSVNMFIQEIGNHETSDYIDVYYSVDNGVNYTRIENWNNLGDANHTLIGNTSISDSCNPDRDFENQTIYFSVPENSTSLKIKVTFRNSSVSENFILDDVRVFGIPSTLNVAENTLASFSMHPNPSQHTVKLEGKEQFERIEIYTISGSLIYSESNISKNNHIINISNFSTGVYLVKTTTHNAHQSTQKLTIK
ncbi:T9SS type A sorting domain-containing protein [Tenacibaculum maritimum]|uniref:T9SS type A sorting domain-containing protein n=2 Tax=Tenacibaculum maritimum TaxID=107401 RepID=UPI00387722E5